MNALLKISQLARFVLNRMSGLAVVSMIFVLAGSGCSSSSKFQNGLAVSQNAVMCDKCRTTWIQEPNGGGKPGQAIATNHAKEVMECSDCDDAAVAYLNTGKPYQNCPTCGGSLTKCEVR